MVHVVGLISRIASSAGTVATKSVFSMIPPIGAKYGNLTLTSRLTPRDFKVSSTSPCESGTDRA